MKNDECIISLVLKSGWKQIYKKDKKNWVQITNGISRKMTAEQLLSHILPVIAFNKEGIKYRKGSKLIVRKKK
ncbi:MAG: hypothetical protein PHD81_01825 [Candidatus Nanoarchaeia archaeon]|nr:hypothetical protein [Candidatus Nanoarchaeia archaeon]MDD5587828.1 hypothetical protein [Candidatus Nanoarchaeia archaeon]